MPEITSQLSTALADRYVIESHLGEGGMATVYLAHDVKHDRKVALKVLRPELAAVIGAERFLHEIKVTANLQHPHILPLHDSGEAGSFLYYVMPYIEGDTLRDKLKRERQLAIEDAVEITRSIASALDYAHRQGVIHRDIKPENVLLHDGQALVADFGIALAVSEASGKRLTETGLSIGTPHYMSPEQAMGDRELDARSDVYSLGAMLYEMLAGEPPYQGSSAQAIVAKVITEKAPPVTAARDTVPSHINAAIVKALNKMPADRFATASAFADALTNTAFAIPQTAAATASTAGTPPRRDVTTIAGWSLAGVIAIAWVVTLLTGGGTGGAAQPMVFTLDPGSAELQTTSRVRVSRDGRSFVIDRRDGNESPLYVRSVDEPDFRPLPGTETARDPAFSPGGEWIVYRNGRDATLMKVALSGGRPITLFTDDGINPYQPHWGDDGTIVFTGPTGMYRVPGTGGVPDLLTEEGRPWPHLLPDGSGVLYNTFAGDAASVEIRDFDTDTTRALIDQGVSPRYLECGHILFAHPDGGLFVVPFDLDSRTVTGGRTPVLDDVNGYYYDVSANGTLVFRSNMAAGGSTRQTELVRVYLDGSVDTLRLAPRNLSDTRISPDGSRLVYLDNSDDQLYLFDFVLGGPTQLTFEGVNDTPVWSPDGTRLAFGSIRDGSDGWDVYVMPVDGSGTADPVVSREGTQFPENWVDDSTITFYERVPRGTSGNLSADLAIASVDGGEPRPFLTTEWNELRLAVSPDGQWGAYQSDETGRAEIYVRQFPSGAGQRRVSDGGGGIPRWAPDGKTIYFERGDSILGAEVQFQPSFQVLRTDLVYTAPLIASRFDVHPDGTHLVVEVTRAQTTTAAGEDAPRSQIVVMLNWFEEMKRRLEN